MLGIMNRKYLNTRNSGFAIAACVMLGLGGCSSAPQTAVTDAENDPYEQQNRAVFAFNMGVDDYVLEPAAKGYKAAVPAPARKAVSQHLEWMSLPKTAVNSSLQGRFENTALAGFRFAINALTFGTADLMEGEEMPYSEDMGQTLASYDVPEGDYLMLPFLGSTTGRGLAGRVGDFILNPLSVIPGAGASDLQNTNIATGAVSYRAQYFDQINDAKYNAVDPYSRLRSIYYQQRDGQLIDNGVENEDDDFDSFFTD